MSRTPYHLILMMTLAIIVMEAERTVLYSSQLCTSSFVSSVAPTVSLPKPSPDLLSNNNKTKYFMCSEESVTSDGRVTEKTNTSLYLKYSLILSANQVGILVAALPSGLTAVCCSSHNVLLTGQVIMATATFMVPLVANIYWIVAVVLEMFVGIGMAIMLPCVFSVMADWENMDWRTTMIGFCLAGRPLGQLASFTLISLTCEWQFFPGWILSHFAIGFLGLLWCGLWMWLGHPKAPCSGCVNECCPSDKKNSQPTLCIQRLIMLKIWKAALREGAVWGIVFAWTATELMWMLLETYTTVLNRIAYINEIWTSAGLLGTSVLTVITGLIADKILDCNPGSFRYLRKVFDSLGKILVIILSIVMVRLNFACTDWFLVMSVVAMVTAIHGLQFAGCYANSIDIGVPCTAVSVSMVMFLASIARLACWNGLFYSIPFDMQLLGYEPPLYAVSAILASSIVLYALFGAPDVNLYLPVHTDTALSYLQLEEACLCCTKPTDQAPRKDTSVLPYATHSQVSQTGNKLPVRTHELSNKLPLTSAILPSNSTHLAPGNMPHGYASNPELRYVDSDTNQAFHPENDFALIRRKRDDKTGHSPEVNPNIPVVLVEETDEPDWPTPPSLSPITEEHVHVSSDWPLLQPIGEQRKLSPSLHSAERRPTQLKRSNAVDISNKPANQSLGLIRNKALDLERQHDNALITDENWKQAESRL